MFSANLTISRLSTSGKLHLVRCRIDPSLKSISNLSTFLGRPPNVLRRNVALKIARECRPSLSPIQQVSHIFRQPSMQIEVQRFSTPAMGSTAGVDASTSDKHAYPSVTITRVVQPADVQMMGFIHGGILLKLVEEAGDIVATKYCNRYAEGGGVRTPVIAHLAGVERSDFMQPMKVGDKVELHAQVTYTSKRSMQVIVNVWTQNMLKNKPGRLAHKSVMWYVPVESANPLQVATVHPLQSSDPSLHSAAHAYYLTRKKMLKSRPSVIVTNPDYWCMPGLNVKAMSSYIIHPLHCGIGDYCKGGVLLKWMDEITGGFAMAHTSMPCVTASVDSTEFYSKIKLGDYITLTVCPAFYSNKTIDVKAMAYVEHFDGERVTYEKVADAFYTFAALGRSGEQGPMIPSFECKTEEDRVVFEERKKKYEERKSLQKKSSVKE